MRNITPSEFTQEIKSILSSNNPEDNHLDIDLLMCEILSQMGYEEGVELFKKSTRWYA